MELRRLAVCLAFFVLAVSQCTEARHSLQRRDAEYEYDDQSGPLNDEAADTDTQSSDDDTQNDGDVNASPQSVKEPSVILTKPRYYEATLGQDMRLQCQVSPENGTVASWYKDSTLYFMGSFSVTNHTRLELIPPSKDLMIRNVQRSDAGTYKCEIPQKVPVSITHTLYFPEKPQIVNMTATNGGSVVENSDVTISCTVIGLPPPKVVWSLFKNNENHGLEEKDGEFSINGNVYSVLVRNIQPQQSGRYMCYTFNKMGSHQKDIMVEVNAMPHVQVHKTAVNSDIKVVAVLQCSAHQTPAPHIRWYKDGVLIEDSSSQFIVSTDTFHSNLTVVPTADKDFGTFTCEAQNLVGKHNRSIDLVQRPVIEGLEADGPKLEWTVHSHQPLEEIELQIRNITGDGEWKKIAVPLPEVQNHKYDMVYSVEQTLQAGKYEAVVKVKNTKSWGASSNNAIVEVVEDVHTEFIQHASVFRENNAAHPVRPASAILSTILMYVLVRML